MTTVTVLWLVFVDNPRAVNNPLEVVPASWHVGSGNPALFDVIPRSRDRLPVSEGACETHAVAMSAVSPLQLKGICERTTKVSGRSSCGTDVIQDRHSRWKMNAVGVVFAQYVARSVYS